MVTPSTYRCALLTIAGLASFVQTGSAAAQTVDRLRAGEIVTVAGGSEIAPQSPATEAVLTGVSAIAVDHQTGTVYVGDSVAQTIFRIEPAGDVAVPFAGIGIAGFAGDGQPASEAAFTVIGDIAVHPGTGDLYVADSMNHRIRRIAKDGSLVETVAGSGVRGIDDAELAPEFPAFLGSGVAGFSGDGGDPLKAELNQPFGVDIDQRGNIYIADSGNNRIRVVNTQSEEITIAGVTIAPGRLQTIAGTGDVDSDGDGGPALQANLGYPKRVRVSSDGDVFVVDFLGNRIRRIDSSGVISTAVAGALERGEMATISGARDRLGFTVDGIAIGPTDELVYGDLLARAVFRRDGPEMASTLVAGIGAYGLVQQPRAVRTPLTAPGPVGVGPKGEVYFLDILTHVIYRVVEGRIDPFAGGGPAGNDIRATAADFGPLANLAADEQGDLYIADTMLHKVRRVARETGIISDFLGTGEPWSQADDRRALEASLLAPTHMLYRSGTLLVVDSSANIIYGVPVQRDANVMRVAGRGTLGAESAGMRPLEAPFLVLQGIAGERTANQIYVADNLASKIFRVGPNGVEEIAGTGAWGYRDGDGSEALFFWPTAVALDPKSGTLYIADLLNHRIRAITRDGTVSTVVGNGTFRDGPSDQGLEIGLHYPIDVEWDEKGRLYIADSGNHRVLQFDPETNQVARIAGTGERGFTGDGGPADAARLNTPRGLALTNDGVLYIADSLNRRVRAMRLNP